MSNISLESLWQEVKFVPNNSQRQAIEHIEDPLFLPAGPGSGKTRVLLWRTVNLIVFHDIKPEEIFLSTFTEKAAFQLKQGLQSLLGLVTNQNGKTYDLSGMFIGTVHSLCQKILIDRRFAINQERTLRPIVLDDLGQYFFIRSNMSDLLEAMSGEIEDVNRLFADKDYVSTSKHIALQNCISLFNRFSEECLEPQEIYDEADDVLKPIIKMYDAYLEKLKHQSILQTDFSLLQTKAFAALKNNPEAAKIFKHVIIDEYQDTNAIQEKIFFKLAEHHQNLCVVGDDDQALYRFRGATVENFVEFPARCLKHFGREPRKIPLSTNYRSRKKIVDFYTQFMDYEEWARSGGDGFYRLTDKEITAHSEDNNTAVIISSQTTRENAYAEIVPLVQKILNDGKVQDPNQIAFLFPALRNNQAVKLMKSALENAGLKVYAPRAGRFLEVEEAVPLFGLFIEIFDRPTREDFKSRDYQDFHSWLDNCEIAAAALLKEDKQLKSYVDDRRREIDIVVGDYKRLTEQAKKNGWELDKPYNPLTMKRILSTTIGISIAAKKSLANRYFERVINERIEKGEPFTLHYIINSASSLDWNVLDLFYRLTGFGHFKQMFDLAERGEDEGPVCNLGLISQYLARYLDEFTSILTGRFIGEESFIRTFYLTFLFSIFRLGESEYEDSDDPFPKGRIPFLTIHQSKGLEFPVVVLPSVYKKDWGIPKVEKLVRPLLDREGEPLDRINRFDTMRLFYVALSRAENLLVIADAKGRGISMDPAFKGILADENLPRIENFDADSLPVAKIESGDIPRNYSYTSDYLQYQKCPRQYMLFRKYGFVASRSQTQFFGTLVHQTLEDLHLLLISQRKKKKPEYKNMEVEQDEILSIEEIEAWVEKTFEENYERLRLDGGHALTPYVRKMALEQIKSYYNKLRDVAENVTDTEVRLTLPEQHTPEGRKFTIEGVVDIVRENDLTIMYDIKTHDADYVRKNPENYEEQLNVYAHIWQTLRGEPLDQTAIIATAFPDAVKDALRKKNDVAIKKQMDLWNPLIDIPLKQEKVQDTINGFGATVDCIESKKFKPPRVEVLQEEVGTTRQKFGTRVCRNCDARFSCTSYRNFVISTNARTGIDFRTYFTDFGSDDEKAETVSLTLEVAPPRDVEIETKEGL